MTRVLMVVPQYPYPVVGGLERQAHELALALRALGVNVQVVSGRVTPTQPDLEDVEGITVHRLAWTHRRWARFLRLPLDLFAVLYRLRLSYDVVHLHQHSWFGLYTIFIARLLGKPNLTKLPNVGAFGLLGLRSGRFGLLKQKILFSADALVAMSNESLTELRSAGFPMERVLVVPNGISLQQPDSIVAEAVRPISICKVVFVGRIAEEKRVDLLLEHWASVQQQCPGEAELEVWGSGPLQATLQSRCAELGLSSSVIWRGHVDNVRSRLPNTDIFVMPSVAEGNSNAILEAMAAGIPVVSTPVGGTPMLVGPHGTQLLFDLEDDSLARILIRLIRDREMRKVIGAKMRARVIDHFNIQRVAQVYASAYELLASRRAGEIYRLAQPVVLGDSQERREASAHVK
jgi:glycosyltransferase involved in cell wall biosynthesis